MTFPTHSSIPPFTSEEEEEEGREEGGGGSLDLSQVMAMEADSFITCLEEGGRQGGREGKKEGKRGGGKGTGVSIIRTPDLFAQAVLSPSLPPSVGTYLS